MENISEDYKLTVMKELTIEEKSQRYDEAFRIAQELYNNPHSSNVGKGYVCTVFPELKESEDERIRKALMQNLKERFGTKGNMGEGLDMPDVLAWLEKQDEHNRYCDSIELKFKVGDWVIFNEYHNSVYQVEKIQGLRYYLRHYTGGSLSVHIDNQLIRLWNVNDAKDGDVLVASDSSIFLFKGTIDSACKHYVSLTTDGAVKFNEGLKHYWETSRAVHPATKEQRDALIKAMADAGYTFDFEKKELKRIEQKPAENRQETKPNGGIICEDFNEGDGYYKVNLAYLSKSQVEFIENLVTSWQNHTNDID